MTKLLFLGAQRLLARDTGGPGSPHMAEVGSAPVLQNGLRCLGLCYLAGLLSTAVILAVLVQAEHGLAFGLLGLH